MQQSYVIVIWQVFLHDLRAVMVEKAVRINMTRTSTKSGVQLPAIFQVFGEDREACQDSQMTAIFILAGAVTKSNIGEKATILPSCTPCLLTSWTAKMASQRKPIMFNTAKKKIHNSNKRNPSTLALLQT